MAARYDLAPVTAVRALPGGEAARLDTPEGSLLLKRRPARYLERIAACHHLIAMLEARGLPVRRPIVALDGTTLVVVEAWAYDLTAWIDGQRFDETTEQARVAGRSLAKLHGALESVPADIAAPLGEPPTRAQSVSLALSSHAGAGYDAAAIYAKAWDRLEDQGIDAWPVQVIHGDWHRGNVLFNDRGEVTAMLDFDEARRAPAIAELADGAVQFATRTSQGSASGWPAETDPDRLAAFIEAYRNQRRPRGLLGGRWAPPRRQADAAALLMAQSLVAQAADLVRGVPADGRTSGLLTMIVQKAGWLLERERWIAGLLRR